MAVAAPGAPAAMVPRGLPTRRRRPCSRRPFSWVPLSCARRLSREEVVWLVRSSPRRPAESVGSRAPDLAV